MTQGICLLPAVAVRENPADKSQLTNQLLYGDRVVIDDSFKDWHYVRSLFDDSAGWIRKSQIVSLKEEEISILDESPQNITDSLTVLIEDSNGEQQIISAGSTLYNTNIEITKNKVLNGSTRTLSKDTADAISQTARSFLNIPYLWGGRTIMGMDSPGFVQIVFKIAGYVLPRSCRQQSVTGEACYLFNETKPGDLIFFTDSEDETIKHVGIYLEPEKIIHVDDKVRIDTIDHYGIYNQNIENYSYKLKAIQRVIGI